ncbi:hypothetical protein [Shewanella frigidimarina]|uniref:hypothetical protein n=1 Tax=Shewanella frigidimarina TaxID=56812 RepID=UPI001FE0B48F|nr:hypothetical protein [Shewanella frigidimarina]
MFKVKGFNTPLISDVYPVFSLSTDNWDDFGTVCTFHLRYHKSKADVVQIGEIKILQKGKGHKLLPPEFSNLEDEYISLGQNLEFYKNLFKAIGSN